ncbi:MAG: hypothetical protein M3P26_10275 [Gemmatimonadota bacterium]|nr:hypothetical protein [Gemmatimonadota bacterium]
MLFVSVAIAGEIMARIDDAVRAGIPILKSPTESDLKMSDSLGTRGRPFAQYRKWTLNNAGFRGPEISLMPRSECVRVAVMGASETLGAYESPEKEYPVQLADSLRRRGCYEIINAAVAGMSLTGQIRLWDKWVSRFQPDIVVIYPSPAFYLSNEAPRFDSHRTAPTARPPRLASRLVDRLRSRIEYPAFIQRRRVAKEIADARNGKPARWFYRQVPDERLALFREHLDSLISSVRARGAMPVLITHAMRFGVSLKGEDRDLLRSWVRFSPRATEEVLLAFELESAAMERDLAKTRGVPLVDAAAIMTGRTEWFGDAVHFTDEGSSVMAGSIALVIEGLSVDRVAGRSTAAR